MAKEAYKLGEDVAEQLLMEIEDAFGGLDDPARRALIIDAIRRGLIDFDDSGPDATLVYRFQKHVTLDNGQSFTQVKLHEPDASEIQRMNKGIEFDINGKTQMMKISADTMDRKTARMLIVLGGLPTVVADRIKRRDLGVLEVLADFFG